MAELAGLEAGTPRKCVPFRSNQALRRSQGDGHVLLYGSGRTIWVNQVARTCGFRSTDTLVINRAGSYICRGDVVRSFDSVSGIPGPSCVLGDFIPYAAGG